MAAAAAEASPATNAALVFGAACAGFLLWNWPPAKIFMGDIGSGYIGYTVAVIALAAARDNPVALWIWLILGGIFFVDATATLVRRMFRGERIYEAHRSHAYQRLARRWGSHRPITFAVLLINVAWLAPCAGLATLHPEFAAGLCALAWFPLLCLVLLVGAGLEDTPRPA